MTPDELASRLLTEIEITHLCDVDLLVFFARHPHTLLTSEQLAMLIGYDLPQIAESLDVLLQSGYLTRAAYANHSARMYAFVAGGPRHEPVSSLVGFVSTRDGRLAVKRALLRRNAEHLHRLDTSRPPGARPDVGTGPTLVQKSERAADEVRPARRQSGR